MTAAVHLLLPYGRLLSPAEAQQHLGIPASTIRTWHQRRATSGLYSAGLLGRAPLFYEADLLVIKRGWKIRDAAGNRQWTLTDLEDKQNAEATQAEGKTRMGRAS